MDEINIGNPGSRKLVAYAPKPFLVILDAGQFTDALRNPRGAPARSELDGDVGSAEKLIEQTNRFACQPRIEGMELLFNEQARACEHVSWRPMGDGSQCDLLLLKAVG
jgi:hypothetical protein